MDSASCVERSLAGHDENEKTFLFCARITFNLLTIRKVNFQQLEVRDQGRAAAVADSRRALSALAQSDMSLLS